MVHVDHLDHDAVLENPVDDTELSSTRRVETREAISQWLSHAEGIRGQRSPHELPTGNGRRLGKLELDRPSC